MGSGPEQKYDYVVEYIDDGNGFVGPLQERVLLPLPPRVFHSVPRVVYLSCSTIHG